MFRRVLRDEGRSLEASAAVHGADEGAEGQCGFSSLPFTVEPRNSIASAEPRRGGALERGYGDSPRDRGRLRRARPVAAGRDSETNILFIHADILLDDSIMPSSAMRWLNTTRSCCATS